MLRMTRRQVLTVLVLAASLPWLRLRPASAGTPSPQGNTFTKPDGEVVALPEGVEILPDGTVLTNGVPTGRYEPPAPSQTKAARMQRFAGQWVPFFHYVHDRALLAPLSLEPRGQAHQGRFISGLVSTPAASEFVYAVTGEEGSKLFLDSAEGAEVKVLAEADVAGEDAWFHERMSLSPNRRWLLVVASPGRKAIVQASLAGPVTAARLAAVAGDLWLIDCAKAVAPRRVMQEVRLLSCSWDASGALVALEAEPAAGGGPRVTVVEAEAGTARPLPELVGHPIWSRTGRTLYVYPGSSSSSVVQRYRYDEHRLERVVEPWVWGDSTESAWSADGMAYASLERHATGATLRLRDALGHAPRTADTSGGVQRLLGWSDEHQLLSYIGADGTLRFCSGAITTGGYERLMSAFPPPPAGADPAALVQSARDGMALDTKVSSIKVQAPDAVVFAWIAAADGPCLVYTDMKEGRQQLNLLRLNRMSVEDLGLNLEQDYKTQVAEALAKENMEYVAGALVRYALEHEGHLPSSRTGPSLEEALKPYLDYVGRMRSVGAPGRCAVSLVVPTGTTVTQIREQIQLAGSTPVQVARYQGEGTLVLTMVARHAESEEPEAEEGRLNYEIVAGPVQ